MTRVAITILLLVSVLPSLVAAHVATPTAGWPTAPPESHGFDSAKLADALVTIHDQAPAAHSVVLLHRGELVLDAAFFPYDGSTPHDLASVTKSFTTTLIGIAIDQGALALDDPVVSFFPDRTIANLDARKERLTVGDLVSMRTGLDCVWLPDEPTLAAMEASEDYVQFTLDLPMVAEPGSTWEYCSPGMHLLSAILTRATGMTELDFAWRYLFGPLGMRDVIWPADRQGYTHGWGDLMLYPEDAAKLGQLVLNRGTWNGQRIVSEAWIAAATKPQVQTSDPEQSYGYGWWIMNESDVGGEIKAAGRGGQWVALYPALDLVAGVTGGGIESLDDVLLPMVPALNIEAFGSPIAPNPDGVARLTATIASLRVAPEPARTQPMPTIASEISGTTYAMDANPANWKTLRVDVQSEAEVVVTVVSAGDPLPLVFTVGLDGVFRLTPGDYGFPLAARGQWEDEQTLSTQLARVSKINTYLVRLRFAGDTIHVEITDQENGAVIPIEGHATTATPAA